MKLGALARSPAALIVGGAVAGVGVLALVAAAVDRARPLADRVRVGRLFRANVRSPTFEADEVCMRATRIEWKDGHVSRLWGVIEDTRHPGKHFVEYEVMPIEVGAVTPPGSSVCAAPMSFRWVELPDDDDHVTLRRGLAYRACVSTGIIPRSMVRDKIVPALEARGFREVTFEEKPEPGAVGVSCDFLIEGRWDREDTTIERPGPVVKAWREG